jgi:hypothetical protein
MSVNVDNFQPRGKNVRKSNVSSFWMVTEKCFRFQVDSEEEEDDEDYSKKNKKKRFKSDFIIDEAEVSTFLLTIMTDLLLLYFVHGQEHS